MFVVGTDILYIIFFTICRNEIFMFDGLLKSVTIYNMTRSEESNKPN
jgi:hypothetical protein